MNKVILMGRLTADPQIRYSQNEKNTAFGSFSIAVDRKFKRDNEPTADFFTCSVIGKQAEFTEKYLKKGTKIVCCGRLQNDSYTNKDGQKVNATKVVIDELEFAESKASASANNQGAIDGMAQINAPISTDMPLPSGKQASLNDFMNIPDNIDEELPFT